ncbi:MAG: hypothetical protein AAFP67_10960, partial [Pseudomonadota bacterium]
MGLAKGDHLYLVDGSGYIFRAYHVMPPLTRRSDGLPVGAVAGFCNMLHRFVQGLSKDAPTHLAVIDIPAGADLHVAGAVDEVEVVALCEAH